MLGENPESLVEFWRLSNLEMGGKSDADVKESLKGRRKTLKTFIASEQKNLKRILYAMFQVCRCIVSLISSIVIIRHA